MITFFRKIRRWLLAENKFSRYLLYAVGEIVLVIIGILIALQINNTNETRKKEKTAIEIFKQIQQDITASVEEANRVIEYYRKKDSLIYLVLSDKVNMNDYIANPELKALPGHYQAFTIHDYGFNKLAQYIDYTPKEADLLLKKLNILYNTNKKDVDNNNKIIEGIVLEEIKMLRDNKSWYWEDYFPDNIDSAFFRYALEDPIYKNYVHVYHTMAIFNLYEYTTIYRTNAIKTYNEITRILKSENEPDMEKFPFKIDADNYKNWTGKYKGKDNGMDFTMEITIEDGILFGEIINYNLKREIFPLTNTKFYLTGYPAFFSLTMDKDKSITSLNYRILPKKVICTKIE